MSESTAPAARHWPIVPSDTVNLSPRPRSLWCETAGTVSIENEEGRILSYTVTAGQILPFQATKVRATGATATVYRWR